MYSKCYYFLNINSIYFEYKISYLFPWWPKQKRNSWYSSSCQIFLACVYKKKKSHIMIIPMNFFLSCCTNVYISFLSSCWPKLIGWSLKAVVLDYLLYGCFDFSRVFSFISYGFSFEYIISFLCWEHIRKVSWTFSFRNQKCISWIPIVLDFGRLKR